MTWYRCVMLCVAAGLAGCTDADPNDGGSAPNDSAAATAAADDANDANAAGESDGMVTLQLDLPAPSFKETPKNVPPGVKVEKPRTGPRKPILVPEGVSNVALNKPATMSDTMPIIGSAELVTDGDKSANEGSWVELGPGVQWAQIDLGQPHEIHAIAIWHYHAQARVYHDVVIRIASDPDFLDNVQTVFNNDHDNSAGLGVGDDLGYWETHEGKLIEIDGVVGRYVRAYSNGDTSDPMNQITEIEVYGKPVE